jgi:hypothetical protein
VLAVGWMPVRPQKLERIASYARECLMDPALTGGVFLFGYCSKMKYVSALDARMVPDPALKLSN